MLDGRIRAGEEEADVTVALPTHPPRRLAVGTVKPDDLAVALRLAQVPAPDDHTVAYRSPHPDLLVREGVRSRQARPCRLAAIRAARRSTQSGENTGRKVVARWMTTATPQPSSGQ